MLIDSHCHLNFPDFKDDLDEVITRSREAGVEQMVSICTKLSEAEEIAGIAKRYDGVFHTVGVHPHEAESHMADGLDAAALVRLAKAAEKCVGIGETGLDYYYENSPREAQKKAFTEHIKAANELDLPVVVHTRAADDDTISFIEEHDFRGVLHCFSTAWEVAEAGLDNGLYISISGIVTFKKADELREVVKRVPLERLLVETDSPFLAPMPNRGKRCEPGFTKLTAEYIAELRGISFEKLAEATTANCLNLFNKIG